jgi:type I restriction enzyme S subunit
MKNGWQTKTLGEVLQKTETVNPLQSPETEFDYIDVSSVSNATFQIETTQRLKGKNAPSRARKLVRENDVLFATVRPTLQRIAVVPEHLDKQVCSTGYFVLRAKPGIDHRFVFYSLFTEDFIAQMESLQKGASYPAVTDGDVKAQVIPVPPLPEQRRIVGILDEAFGGIATAKANAEKNLQNARALFESHLQSIFTQRGKGWVEKTIGETCVLRSGTTLPKELEKPSGEVPYLKVADMNLAGNLNGVTCSTRYVTRRDVNASNLLPVGTTIFPKRGGAILTNKKRLTTCVICADLNIMGVTPKQFLLPAFLFNYFLNLDLREINNGSSIPQINNYGIEPLTIAFPHSMEEQQAIVDRLDSLATETQRLASIYRQKLAALEALKKSLLHQAFTGQLTMDNG